MHLEPRIGIMQPRARNFDDVQSILGALSALMECYKTAKRDCAATFGFHSTEVLVKRAGEAVAPPHKHPNWFGLDGVSVLPWLERRGLMSM